MDGEERDGCPSPLARIPAGAHDNPAMIACCRTVLVTVRERDILPPAQR